MCPASDSSTFPEAWSQRFMVRSSLPLARVLPSGLKATAPIHPAWPRSVRVDSSESAALPTATISKAPTGTRAIQREIMVMVLKASVLISSFSNKTLFRAAPLAMAAPRGR